MRVHMQHHRQWRLSQVYSTLGHYDHVLTFSADGSVALCRFEIIPDADMDFVIAGPTPDLCHAALIQAISDNKELSNIETSRQGEWFFGLSHPNVIDLLESSPQTEKCQKFKGFKVDSYGGADPSVSFDALQRYIARSSYHTLEVVKDEPPDDLFEQSDSNA